MTTWLRPSLLVLAGLALAGLSLAGCRPAPTPSPTPSMSLTDKAAVEATAIVQRAQATSLVMRAEATAAALTNPLPAESAATQSTPAAGPSATPAATRTPRPQLSPTAAATRAEEQEGEDGEDREEEDEAEAAGAGGLEAVELVGVGFAADTGFIVVQFKAPKRISDKWYQDKVGVIDEATGAVYKDIPVMPILGPMLARPIHPDQIGYVMFMNNAGQGLKSGDLVTVVLGDFRREHVKVQ